MAVGDPIGSVGVGLGKKPNPSASAFNGAGGTAVVYHDSREYFRLMLLRGHTLPEWFAVCPPGPAALSTLTLGCGKLKGQAGSIGVRFSTVQVVDVRNVYGAVEVTLHYGAVQRLPLGGNVLPSAGGPLATRTTAVNTTRSNIRTN